MAERQTKNELKILADTSLPTLFIDNLVITSRGDGMFLIRFLAALPAPEGLKEEVRMVVPRDSLEKMLDVMCNHAKYSPKIVERKAN